MQNSRECIWKMCVLQLKYVFPLLFRSIGVKLNKNVGPCVGRFPVVSVGVVRWVESTVTEPSYFKLCTEHTPIHLALLDEVVTCHLLLHPKVLQLLIQLFESKQDELEILVQVCVYVYPITTLFILIRMCLSSQTM
jgi:hypothetical protein